MPKNLEILVESSPTEVTVFLSGAELKHENELKLTQGQNIFRFVRLPASINANSISFNFGQDVKIISVSGEINYSEKTEISPERQLLEDLVSDFEDEIQKINNEIEALQSEKILLNKNMDRIGSNNAANNVSVADLQAFATHYRNQIREVNNNISTQNRNIKEQNKRIENTLKKVEKLRQKDAIPTFEILLIVDTKETKTILTKWSYVVSDAGWSPAYDLRGKGIDKPIHFTYKGTIYNNAGVDWNNVKLKLSTADITQNATPPYITSWKINFEEAAHFQNNIYQQQNTNNNKMSKMAGSFANEDSEMNNFQEQFAGENSSDVLVSELSTEFEIKELYNIPSDNMAYAVEINEYELKADYSYLSTPKMDKDAFLMAKILGWESLNLIEGEATIYYNDTYVGKTYINLRRADDLLEVSLGRDKKVIVSRVKKQDFSSKSFLSNAITETFIYELSVRNTNTMPIELELKDQVPVSGNSEITVEILEVSAAAINKENGLLFWKLNLGAGESKSFKLSYAIKYPKNRKINVQRVKVQKQYRKM